MPTVGEVLARVPLVWTVLAGAVGLGREVRRVVHVRPPTELMMAVGQGDLIVYTRDPARQNQAAVDRALVTLLSAGVAGVLTDVEPLPSDVHAAERAQALLIHSRARMQPEHILTQLEQALEQRHVALAASHAQLQHDFMDLAGSGATSAMLLERLAETTAKTALLQGRNSLLEHIHPAAHQALEPSLMRQALDASDAAAERWIVDTADATVANVLYLELTDAHLVRLVAPVWIDGRAQAALSLLARPIELGGRDRLALLAAARALARMSTLKRADVAVAVGGQASSGAASVAAVVLRSPEVSVQRLAQAARDGLDLSSGGLTLGQDDVRAWLLYESADDWQRSVSTWHRRVSRELGLVSIGHALRRGAYASDSVQAVVQAAEAALVGDRLFGPGHLTSFADAQVAKFLLSQHDATTLRAFYERAVGKLRAEDLKRDSELVTTLEAYCETSATQRTAERLGVHRNTVLYRLKRIEEITCADLEDGATRLLFQLGLVAGRLLRSAGIATLALEDGQAGESVPLRVAI